MPIGHLCGPDEILQLGSRRPAEAHFVEVLAWIFEPGVEPIVAATRAFGAGISFVMGFALGSWTSTWSPAQAEWGAQKLVHRVSEVWTNTATSAGLLVGSTVAAIMGATTLAVASGASEWIGREVHKRSERRMGQLYPIVVSEWTAEVFGTLGAVCRTVIARISVRTTFARSEKSH